MQLWDLESKGSKGGQGKVWAKDSDPKDPRAVGGTTSFRLTPVSGWVVHASSEVTHFVSIRVSREREGGRREVIGDEGQDSREKNRRSGGEKSLG